MIRALALAALLTGCATADAKDEAQVWCAGRAELAQTLHKNFNETPVYAGLTLDGLILEIFSTPDGRTFSLVVTHPIFNNSCIVYAGFGWKARGASI